MILTLLSHQWKAFRRSRGAGKTLILRLLMGLVLLYLLAIGFLLGFYIRMILLHIFPGQDAVTVFCRLLLYYFPIDLAVRFLFQDLPVLATRPYLLQNIRRRQLVNFLNIRSLFHYLNLLPICLFLPFIFTDVRAEFGLIPALALAGTAGLLVLTDHFLIQYIKGRSLFNHWWLAAFVGINIVLILFVPLRPTSLQLFFGILHHPVYALAFIVPSALVYLANRRFLYNNLYFEALAGNDRYRQGSEYAWLSRWGITGELIGLEYRLILRNRKPRTLLLFGVAGLAYGIVFNRSYDGHPVMFGMVFFTCMVLNGTFLYKYGTEAFAWQSCHFDGLMTANIRSRDYIRSKFYGFSVIATAAYIISLAYGFLDQRMIPMLTVAWLYNLGCNIPVMAWCATFSYRSIDPGKGVGFNFQQKMTTSNMYYMTLMMAPPFFAYLIFSRLLDPWAGVYAIGVMGVAGILLRSWFINLVVKEFSQRKHLILEGFREK